RRLAALWGVLPGTTAVVATTCDRGLDAALALHAVGVRVAAVADLRPDAASRELGAAVQAAGIRLLAGMTVVRALGRNGVSGAVLAAVDATGKATGALEEVECDLLAVSGGTAPATSLLLQSGAKARYDAATSRFLADVPDGIVHAAGAVAGHEDAEAAAASGTTAGLDAAVALGLGGAGAERALTDGRKRLEALPASSPVAAPPACARDGRRGGKAFVDLDEDITAKDIAYAVAEGYDSIELSKRYTTVTMGPSQGRHSQLAAIRVLAAVTGQPLDDVGITTARPPWSTVPMGALAGRPFEPAKRSAIHGRHRELGATVKWAGDWRRAYDYGDPEGEAQAVHQTAGLIDVSTLGKLIVRGPDAGAFLDRLYPNRVSTLKPGRIRYGVLTSETGRITDDGTIARLDNETFYVTTTSSGAGAVLNWFTWWLADWRMQVQITDVTQASAAMNLAGPRSREILTGLTDTDVSAEGMTYLDALPAVVGGVSCLVLRIGFTGELGYEIHCPAPQAQDLWDALMQAGAEHGIRPFGLEPQRILRLQKLHILIGQDTDSESTPYGAAMPWIVKLDKDEDFIGRWALERAAEHGAATALVGFSLPDGDVPAEGAAILDPGGAPIGQVTSARHSRQVGKVIGMGWVPVAQASDGATVTISYEGATYEATVQTSPFHDPEGALVRS
ncbi:MAG: sarcosine oxidase, subunit alpha, partial [Solirubrobacteraceae bacterium]|nr:sarcosine oxidase, subunit alpha [Solirubrobacteraceae bacterium]